MYNKWPICVQFITVLRFTWNPRNDNQHIIIVLLKTIDLNTTLWCSQEWTLKTKICFLWPNLVLKPSTTINQIFQSCLSTLPWNNLCIKQAAFICWTHIVLHQIGVCVVNAIIKYWDNNPFTSVAQVPCCLHIHVGRILTILEMGKKCSF